MKGWVTAASLVVGVLTAHAQQEVDCDSMHVWSPKEANWWRSFEQQTQPWDWTPALRSALREVACSCAVELNDLSDRMAQVEALGGPGLADSLARFRKEQERIQQARDAAFMAAVPMAWWPEMQAVLHPPRPAVLHFGVHDRMKCNVCVPGAAE